MTATTETVVVDQFIARPPEKVWAALTQPGLIERWWVPADIAPVVGHRFHLQMPTWGPQPGEVLEVKEPERLVHTLGDWTLTWRLTAEGRGTRLILEHAGFDLENPQHRFALDNMGPGWRDVVLPRLAQVLESAAE